MSGKKEKGWYGSLFCYSSPDSHLFLDTQVLEGLRSESQLSQDFIAYWTRCRTKGEKTINARFAPEVGG
jgi:hypothetical protein